MSNTQLARDGWKNGKAIYALQSDGKTKFCVTCKFCKKSHYVWMTAYVHHQYHVLVPDWKEQDAAYASHVEQCELAKARRDHYLSRGLSMKSAMDSVTVYLGTQVFHWNDRGDGGHKCNARCMSACGPSCECRCQGKNHGGN